MNKFAGCRLQGSTQRLLGVFVVSLIMLLPRFSAAQEILHPYAKMRSVSLLMGGGEQPRDRDQFNKGLAVDYQFAHWQRGPSRYFHFGVSATALESDTDTNNEMYAVSIYPQLTFYATPTEYGIPFAYVRALGPTYLSHRQLGSREQGEHVCFLAQIGVGWLFRLSADQFGEVSLSNRHFSNAGWFSPNDGIDIPLALNIGVRFK